MSGLNTDLNLTRHDDLYAGIVSLFDDLSDEQSLKAMAKLVLLLANHIGDEQVIADAVEAVRSSCDATSGVE